MSRNYDPLALVPSATAIRRKLAETELLVRRLRILLQTAEQLEEATSLADPAAVTENGGSSGDD